MHFTFATGDATKARADALVIPLFEKELTEKKRQPPALVAAEKKLKGALLKAAQQENFKAKDDELLVVHTQGKLPAQRVILVGMGPRASYRAEALRLAAGRAVKAANARRAKSAVIALPVVREFEGSVRAAVEGFELGTYRFDKWRTTIDDEKLAPRVEKVSLVLPPGLKKAPALEQTVADAQAVSAATNWARDLVNEPAGALTPAALTAEAQKMAKAAGLSIEVLERKDIEKLKMGMFLGVTQGSHEQPRLVHLRYVPKDEGQQKRAPLCFIGKAITFDSGGLSLKTAEGMVDMKTDMAGSAAVLGAMQVIARLAPPFPVHGFFGACENMPSGSAYRPGDILVSRLGKTVEITNTDAEGRLVLGDLLAYAAELKPALLIDVATLTGACVVALGNYVAGVFGEDDQAVWNVLEAARAAGEEAWRMPVTELQKDALRSDVADLKNAGERWGGAINAALFLKEFVGRTPWVHLDIAGPSQSPKVRGYFDRGATGYGVRTLVEVVRRHAGELEAAAHAQKAEAAPEA